VKLFWDSIVKYKVVKHSFCCGSGRSFSGWYCDIKFGEVVVNHQDILDSFFGWFESEIIHAD
jgi:hypothetical protein